MQKGPLALPTPTFSIGYSSAIGAICTTFLACRVYAESSGIIFPPFLEAIVNFYIKLQNTFISETE